MEDLALLFTLGVIVFFALTDLIVGVSNDAINFLNSAVGSKVTSLRNILILVSLGICIGAVFSNDMMEVARKGIFNPQAFYFKDILIIFLAVMVVDVIMLNFFNSIGIPTSTTVSIVFELLGAALMMGIIKSYTSSGTLFELHRYINSDRALHIILGIFISIVLAFIFAALVQFITRIIFTFHFENKPLWLGSIFAGLAITSIVYFMLFKGLVSLSDFTKNNTLIADHITLLLFAAFVLFSLLTYLLKLIFRVNIFKTVVLSGTFALALAFAGNDLVNFIGVPLAAYQSFVLWKSSGLSPAEFPMTGLSDQIYTPPWILLSAGMIMVATLWFSIKARYVLKTAVDLSSQSSIDERFKANNLSRGIVRVSLMLTETTGRVLGKSVVKKIDASFVLPKVNPVKVKAKELPAFDLIRASVNLMVASVLISLATDRQLPLSTTYITFMVSMGTSMADRAWGRERAVYRVSGVLKVIGGFFITAIAAFLLSGGVVLLIYGFGLPAVILLTSFTIGLLVKSFLKHRQRLKSKKWEDRLKQSERKNIKEVIDESAEKVILTLQHGLKIYAETIKGLSLIDLKILKNTEKSAQVLKADTEKLREETFFLIRDLEDSSVEVSRVYIHIVEYLQNISRSLSSISGKALDHTQNNHKALRFNQIKELKALENKLGYFIHQIIDILRSGQYEKISHLYENENDLQSIIDDKIDLQVTRTRGEDASLKNTMLYFSLLLETKELVSTIFELVALYYKENRVVREIAEGYY